MTRGIPRDQSIERRIVHRMKIARGHLDKVIRMVEDGEYCIDVINQSIAVQSALKSIDQLMLKNHMQTCVASSIKGSNTNDFVEEIVKVFEKK